MISFGFLLFFSGLCVRALFYRCDFFGLFLLLVVLVYSIYSSHRPSFRIMILATPQSCYTDIMVVRFVSFQHFHFISNENANANEKFMYYNKVAFNYSFHCALSTSLPFKLYHSVTPKIDCVWISQVTKETEQQYKEKRRTVDENDRIKWSSRWLRLIKC